MHETIEKIKELKVINRIEKKWKEEKVIVISESII
jgi:hypothetical protein